MENKLHYKVMDEPFLWDDSLRKIGLRYTYLEYPYFYIGWEYWSGLRKFMDEYKAKGAFGKPDDSIAYFNNIDDIWEFYIEDRSIVYFLYELVFSTGLKYNIIDEFHDYLIYLYFDAEISNFVYYSNNEYINKVLLVSRYSEEVIKVARDNGFVIEKDEDDNSLWISDDLNESNYKVFEEMANNLLCYKYDSFVKKIESFKRGSQFVKFK